MHRILGSILREEHIVALTDKILKKAFDENFHLAGLYCEKVLFKEALCVIFQSVTGANYHDTEKECLAVQNASMIQAMKDGLKICKQKKEELSTKF